MREEELISAILGNFARSAKQKNKAFGCDAEIVAIGDNNWGITMDDFSAEEDMLGDLDPFMLGQNLATSVLSDLFACGAKPEFFMQSIVLSENAGDDYVNELAKGVSRVLQSAECYLLGGDIGRGECWRYTGVAMGLCGRKYLSRILPEIEQAIWVTGTLGDANFAALIGAPAPAFELRLEEAKYVRENATSCIDTSGGFADSLWMLKTLNKTLRFEISTSSLPIAEEIGSFCKDNNLPPQAFLFGGAGEYELLFTTPADVAPDIEATKVGCVYPSGEAGLFFELSGHFVEMTCPPICPRQISDRSEYVQKILRQVKDVFG